MIGASDRSALSLARELRVSDTLIRRVRNGELWNAGAESRNHNDLPRRVVATPATPAAATAAVGVGVGRGLRAHRRSRLAEPHRPSFGDRVACI